MKEKLAASEAEKQEFLKKLKPLLPDTIRSRQSSFVNVDEDNSKVTS